MTKKENQAMRRGYKEAGALYWTKEMTDIINAKKVEFDAMARKLTAYRVGFFLLLAFSAGVAFLYARATW